MSVRDSVLGNRLGRCQLCSKEFIYYFCESIGHKKFCSRACEGKSRRGIPHSEEHNKKLSEARFRLLKKGFKCKYHYGKDHPMFGRTGEKNPNWKGGITTLNRLIRALPEYFAWRDSVYKRDNFTCQDCGSHISNTLEAHHKKAFHSIIQDMLKEFNQFSPIEDKEILVRIAINYKPLWDIKNGETLCLKCHELTESFMQRIKK
jgi:hypothetical protein